jgi:diacylglycerol kinase family enzyme
MLGQTARPLELQSLPKPKYRVVTEPKVAVLLNANARRVTDRVVKAMSHVVPEEDLYISRSLADGRRIAEAVIEKRYQVVFCGGGDGTFMSFVNAIFQQLEQRSPYHSHRLPRFGVLRLGTGNGLANLVNASRLRSDRLLDDVLRARAGEVPGYTRVDLIRVDGKRTVFAGMGVDGKIINDYNAVKGRWTKGPLGYLASLAFMTVPHYIARSTYMDCEVINGRTAAYRLGPDGNPVGEPIPPGGILYKGKLNLAAAGTTPYLGFGMKAFPFAGQRRGMMHLRLCAVPVSRVLANLHKQWAGRWFPDCIHDFHAAEATINFERPMPLEIAGDAEGYHRSVHLDIAPEQVELVDFTGSVN